MYKCKCKCKWSEVPFNPPNCAASPGKKMKTLLNQVFSQENVSKSEVTIFLILHEKVEYQNIVGEKNILYQPSHVWNHITGNRSFALSFLVHGFLAPPPVLENLKNQDARSVETDVTNVKVCIFSGISGYTSLNNITVTIIIIIIIIRVQESINISRVSGQN